MISIKKITHIKVFMLILAAIVPLILCLSSCAPETKLTSWNDNSQALQKIKAYVDDVTTEGSENFIPEEDRIVVTDNDGTLYGEKAPLYYDCVLYVHRVLYDNTFQPTPEMVNLAKEVEKCFATHELDSSTDTVISAKLQDAFAGMTLKEFDDYCEEFFKTPVEGFNNVTYKEFFYQPMKELVNYLQEKKFDVYIVTGVDRMAARSLIRNNLNIKPDHIIGTDTQIEYSGNGSKDTRDYKLKKTDKTLRSTKQINKNTNTTKVSQIIEEIGKQPVLSMGNTSGDNSMALYTTYNNKYKSLAVMVLQDDNVRDNCSLEKAAKNKATWEENGWTVISMKNEWKTIYGDKVTKK